ncbi:unnamed protein product [Cochlearia groenlandica]
MEMSLGSSDTPSDKFDQFPPTGVPGNCIQGEFAAANAIIDLLCQHLVAIGGEHEYENMLLTIYSKLNGSDSRKWTNTFTGLGFKRHHHHGSVYRGAEPMATNRDYPDVSIDRAESQVDWVGPESAGAGYSSGNSEQEWYLGF